MAGAQKISATTAEFDNIIAGLQQTAKLMRDCLSSCAQPQWFQLEGWEGDPVNDTGQEMTEPFKREPIAELLNAATEGEGGINGDFVSGILMADYLSAAERAFRMRHSTKVRFFVHGAARKEAHQRSEFGLYGGTHKGAVLNAIKAGGDSSNG